MSVLAISIIVLLLTAALRTYQTNAQRENVATAAVRIAKSQHNGTAMRTPQSQRKPALINRFRAVSIATPDTACTAAQALAGKRFLVAENNVPALPLGGCDAASCTCTYVHHNDRREKGVERRAPSSLRTQLYPEVGNVERRGKRGRRITDWE